MENNNEGKRFKVIQIEKIEKNDSFEINKHSVVNSIALSVIAALNYYAAYVNISLVHLSAAFGLSAGALAVLSLSLEKKTECKCKISELSEEELEELMNSGAVVEDIIEVSNEEKGKGAK